MGGRHNKPLFDLLGEESGEGRRPIARAPAPSAPQHDAGTVRTAPAPTRDLITEPKPRPAPAPAPTHDAPASLPPAAFSVRDGVVTMSVYSAYLAVAGVVIVSVLVWAIAYNSGRRHAEHELVSRLPQDLPAGVTDPRALVQTHDPLQEPRADPPSIQPGPSVSSASPVAPAAAPGPAPVPGTGPVITPTGSLDADPRATGLNYQVLATSVPRDEARDMVAFLSKNGLDVIAIRVDRASPADNNSPQYKVVSTVGLTGAQYRNNDPIRLRQQSEVLRVGQLWKKTRVGRPDFGSTYWESLKP